MVPEIVLEDINNSGINNELIAFTANRNPLLIENIDWHANMDTVFSFEDPVIIDVTGWILNVGNTSFEYLKNRILRGMEDCNRIFAHEGTGIQFNIGLIDASGMDGIRNHYNLSTKKDMDEVGDFLEVERNKLNLFFTKTVAQDPSRAYTTFGISEYKNHIAFGMHAVDGGVMAHEIGHTLTLLHYDYEIIGIHNVMSDFSNLARVYFTEGQIYHMWFNAESALHTVYNLQIPTIEKTVVLKPNPYLSVWRENEKPPWFDVYADNDSIK